MANRTNEHNLSFAHGDAEWIAEGEGCAICDLFHQMAAEESLDD